MLTDALRPPEGYRVDVAVGTTYSLDLTALLLAPLSFALFDHVDGDDLGAVDPIRLLEAVRRHSEHTTVFCQAGAIAVPSAYRSMLTFVEESVHEVLPPTDRLFHPKVWALRFVNGDGERLHRFLCLSRNLTFDRSWDTALRLDEDSHTESPVNATPLGEFLAALPALAVRPIGPTRTAQLESLAQTLRQARLAPPSPFRTAQLMPLGLGQSPWPFPDKADRLLAISPFLDQTTTRSLGVVAGDKTLVTRAETLDRLGGRGVEGWRTQTLQRLVEVELGDEVSRPMPAADEWSRVPEGLHAKTFVIDRGKEATVITGSANLTSAGWGGNIEFDVAMTGPRKECGVAATLEGTAEAPGLDRMLEDYIPQSAEGIDDAAQETSWQLELFHQRLAGSMPNLHVERIDDDRVNLHLEVTPADLAPGASTVWPVSLPQEIRGQTLAARVDWIEISRWNVTPFIGVETTAGSGEARITRRCALEATLTGDVATRRQEAVSDVLRSKEDVLRYLLFLLGDPSYSSMLEHLAGSERERRRGDGASGSDVALFEPLVRATGRDSDALARVAALVTELRDLPRGDSLVPDGFDDLWQVVWAVHQESQE